MEALEPPPAGTDSKVWAFRKGHHAVPVAPVAVGGGRGEVGLAKHQPPAGVAAAAARGCQRGGKNEHNVIMQVAN